VNLTCSRALLNKVSRLSHELVYLYPTAVWADAHFEEQHRRTSLAIAEAGLRRWGRGCGWRALIGPLRLPRDVQMRRMARLRASIPCGPNHS